MYFSLSKDDKKMTYCVGIMLDSGMILASDSRTHAGVTILQRSAK